MTWDLEWSEVAVLDSNSEALGVPQWELMQAASKQLAGQVKKMLPDGGAVLFLCGPGNNGGDGYLAAANLIEASIKLLRTLLLSPIQQIFKVSIDFFVISSIVKTSDKICVG